MSIRIDGERSREPTRWHYDVPRGLQYRHVTVLNLSCSSSFNVDGDTPEVNGVDTYKCAVCGDTSNNPGECCGQPMTKLSH